jgi:hypothetical protein
MKRKQSRKFAEHGGQARVLAFVAFRVVRPIMWVLLALASVVMAPIQQFAYAQTRLPVFNIGASPASMNVSNLPQSQVIFYDKNFVKNLKANTCFVRTCSRRELPENSGNQLRLFMYQTLGANIAQTSEGTVGSGIVVSVVNNTATIGQYADYVNLSDLSLMTSIDPALENIQRELAYRLGLSLSTLVRNTADGASAIDSSVSAGSLAYNVPFTKSNITSAVQSLAGRNVAPFDRGRMTGVIHPFIVGDALNDTSNNSLTDVLKRTVEGQEKLMELPSPDGDQVPVLEWAGVSFHQSTMVTQTLNYQAQAGKTALRTYIMGEDALIAISLGKREGAMIGNGDWRNLKLWMYKAQEPSGYDPSRVIGGWTSYNTKFVTTLPPDTVQRLRIIDAVAATVA